ncbi:MAG: hypothetical protein ACXVDD_05195 [Polyangia bacterium]
MPAELRDRALGHIALHFEGGAIGRVVPIYRPDVTGPAYFAVEVTRGDQSVGSMYLATGAHDAPIPKWSEQPGLLVDELAAAARALGREPARFEYVGIYDAAVDDRGNAIVTTMGDAGRWAGYVRRATDAGDERHAAYARAAADAWALARKPTLDVARIPTAPIITCDLPEAPLYNQMQPHDVGNGEGDFPSGCGATAWGMLIGWIDQRAAANDPKWLPYRGLYREGGIQNATAFDAVAPGTYEWGPRRMTDQIRLALGSTGAYTKDGPQTATTIYQMGYIGYYLAPLGLDQFLNWPTHHIGGAASDGLKPYAIDYICNQRQPAILGIDYDHYPLATAYNRDAAGNESFRLNMGWGGRIEWQWPLTFFVASLTPNGSPPGQPYPNSGIEIMSATYGNSGIVGQLNNASASMTAACNTRFDCTYTVNAAALGNPAPGTSKPFTGFYRCGNGDAKPIAIAAEANGKSIRLTCPATDPRYQCPRDPWGGCTAPVHRAYKTPQHFYTTDYTEGNSWGFHIEIGYNFFLDLDGGANRKPFYRCYFPSSDRHFYTTDAGCESPTATNEGSLGYIFTTQLPGSVPLYRSWNGSTWDHLYTLDWNEAHAPGYAFESVPGYVMPAGSVHWDAPSPN